MYYKAKIVGIIRKILVERVFWRPVVQSPAQNRAVFKDIRRNNTSKRKGAKNQQGHRVLEGIRDK